VPLSGAADGYKADIDVYVLPDQNGVTAPTYVSECKVRRDGFKQIYEWKGDNDFLFIKADRREPLVVMIVEQLKMLL